MFVFFLQFLLLLSMSPGLHATHQSVMIDASAAPETNTSLQSHLCGSGSREMVSNTTLHLSGGVHHLKEGPFCLIQNLENITMQGQQTHPRTVVYCQSETEARRGFAFFNVSNLHLSNLAIVNCGREVPSELPGHVNNTFLYLGPLQKAVVIITHSTNVTVENVSIDMCFGFGTLFINPLTRTLVRNVSVTGTTSQGISECIEPSKRSDMLCSGSGVVFIFNDTDITEKLVKHGKNYIVSLSIVKCSFFNNSNFIPTSPLLDLLHTVTAGYSTQRILLTGGFSIAVYMGQRNYLVSTKVINTSIISNTGNLANMIVVHYNTIRTSETQVDGVVFKDNIVQGNTGRGAGLLIVVLLFSDSLSSFPQYQDDIYNLIKIDRSLFIRNMAYIGGSILLFMTPQNVSDTRLVVKGTTFTDNAAEIGPALYVFKFKSLINNKEIYIYFEDIVASGNTFPGAQVSENSPENAGVFLIRHVSNITIVGTANGNGCLFHNNSVSVLFAVATNVILRGHMTFGDNHGFRGGALNLVDSSILFIYNSSTISFVRNTAFREGGAIYINTLGSSVTDICAIQFFLEKQINILNNELKLLDLSIVFSNNSALVAGNSVYGNPLYYCQFFPITSIEYISHILYGISQAFPYDKVFDFQTTVGNELSELNSIEELICVCPNGALPSRFCTLFHALDHPVIPGDTFVLFLNPVDVVGAPVASFLYSFPRSANFTDTVSIDTHQSIRLLPGLSTCSPVEFTIFAPEDTTLYIDLFATVGKEKVIIELNTTSCPPGFKLQSYNGSGKLSCQCSGFIATRLESTCNLTNYTVARPTNYWVGTTTDDSGGLIIQFVTTCPTDYCRREVTHIDLRVPDQLCAEGRTGTLCGACREGLSSVFGTAECRECSNTWVALLPLFALVGVTLVASGLLLDLTITHGLINGFFFYSYIVVVNSNIFFQGNKSGFLFWFLSWTNMDSGFSICFYNGMTEPAKLGLQYVFPVYIILMIAIIIVLTQYSLLIQRTLSQLDGIHMLVTMLYISFLNLFRTVIDTFTFVSIVSEYGEKEDVVWFFDGTLQASNSISVFLILLGSLTMAGFILPYMGFFTFSTYIQRYVSSTRLNAYVDASLAPYKDELRYWFGARLILISTIYIIIANRGTNNPALTLTLEVSLLFGFAMLQTYISPFKKTVVALLDMSFLLNLVALTLVTLYTIQNGKRLSNQENLVAVSVSITFITFIGIILWHLLNRLQKNERIKTKMDQMLAMTTAFFLALKLRIKKGIVVKREGEESSCHAEGGTGVLQSARHYTASSEPFTVPQTVTTMISLQDMVAAPDNGESLQPSSFQLREPVLDFLEK